MSRRPRQDRRDRGSTSLEFALLSLVFLFLVFLVVQAALYFHARNVIKAEAEGVARSVRAYPTTNQLEDRVPTQAQVEATARTAAREQWARLDDSGDTTSEPVVTRATVNGFEQVQITIQADPILILPGLFSDQLTITATAGGPFEVFKRSGNN